VGAVFHRSNLRKGQGLSSKYKCRSIYTAKFEVQHRYGKGEKGGATKTNECPGGGADRIIEPEEK